MMGIKILESATEKNRLLFSDVLKLRESKKNADLYEAATTMNIEELKSKLNKLLLSLKQERENRLKYEHKADEQSSKNKKLSAHVEKLMLFLREV